MTLFWRKPTTTSSSQVPGFWNPSQPSSCPALRRRWLQVTTPGWRTALNERRFSRTRLVVGTDIPDDFSRGFFRWLLPYTCINLHKFLAQSESWQRNKYGVFNSFPLRSHACDKDISFITFLWTLNFQKYSVFDQASIIVVSQDLTSCCWTSIRVPVTQVGINMNQPSWLLSQRL